jgi:hypothetical protein
VLFDRPGVVSILCEIHSEAPGFVVVCQDHLFARPDARGEFRLPRLAAGTYTVKAWHPLYGEASQHVTVRRGAVAMVRLTF